jgi:hypothetical protein
MLINFEIPCWKFWVEVEDDKNSFWSFLVKITVWSPKFGKNYSLVPGVKLEILDRIEDELWTIF